MRQLTIIVDLDGVCADVVKAALSTYNDEWDDNLTYKDITTFHFDNHAKPEAKGEIYNILCRPGFYADLDPLPGAIETLALWKKIGHRSIFCSSPPTPHGAAEKYEWVDNHFGPAGFSRKDVILANQKDVVCGDVFLDDYPKNARRYREAWPNAYIATIGHYYNHPGYTADPDIRYYNYISGLYPDTGSGWEGIEAEVLSLSKR